MESNIAEITKSLKKSAGASKSSLDKIASKAKISLPNDYVKFMLTTDGAEGPIGKNSYTAIWSAEEVITLNEDYDVDEYAPGILLFASDGGNIGYAFDMRTERIQVVSVDLLDLSLSASLGATFSEFLEHLSRE